MTHQTKLLSRTLGCFLVTGFYLFQAPLCGHAALEASHLQGITLQANTIETRIKLKTANRIASRVVSADSDRIVIDLDTRNTAENIQTDFSNAENVSQVIFKPISSDRLRMTIHGDHLGAPVIILSKPRTAQRKRIAPTVVFEQESEATAAADRKPATLLMARDTEKSAVNPASAFATETASEMASSGSERVNTDTLSSDTGITTEDTAETDTDASTDTEQALTDEAADSGTDAEAAEPDGLNAGLTDRAALVDARHSEQTLLSPGDDSETDFANGPSAAWLDFATGIKKSFSGMEKGLFIRLLALGILAISLGLFIRHKLQQNPDLLAAEDNGLTPQGPGLLDRLFGKKPQSAPKPARNRKMFTESLAPTRTASQLPLSASPRQQASGRPIGLNGISPAAQHTPLPASRPVVAPNQALSQYARNAARPVQSPAGRPASTTAQEIKRSAQMKQVVSQTQNLPRPNARPAAAPGIGTGMGNPLAARPQQARPAAPTRPQPQPRNTQAGLPANNTEVLDFLRSVAELMEKDGETHLAQGIKKGMTQGVQPRR